MDFPKPGVAHRKLERLEGKWTGDETWHPSPLEPRGAKAVGTFDFRKDIDGFFLITDYDERIEGGPGIRGHGVVGWDPKEKSYTLHWFDNFGKPPAAPGRGQWKGNTLAFDHDYGEHRGRTIFELDGKDNLNFRIEQSEDGKTWSRPLEGKYKREPAGGRDTLREDEAGGI
jgi:uncharacterized protein DUF1579